MKTLILTLIIANSALATCFMTKTVCSTDTNFQNSYELVETTCSAPGGPARTSKMFYIYNKITGKRPIFSKELNYTRDNWFQVTIDNSGRVPTLSIDDRSLATDTNVNITTNGKELYGYKCKARFR